MDQKNKQVIRLKQVSLVALWIILLTSCDPYAGLQTPTAVVTAIESTAAAATARPTIEISISPTPQTCAVKTNVPTGRLNVRTGAGTQYPAIALLHEGQVLTLTGSESNGWIEVIAGNLSGWINSNFCKGD